MADDDDYEIGNVSYACTSWAPIVGFAGITCAVVFASKYEKIGRVVVILSFFLCPHPATV